MKVEDVGLFQIAESDRMIRSQSRVIVLSPRGALEVLRAGPWKFILNYQDKMAKRFNLNVSCHGRAGGSSN